MKSIFLSFFFTWLILVCPSYAQENLFEGVIRVAASTDLDKLTRDINNIGTGNTLADIITKSIMKPGGLNEVFAATNGQFEFLIKVKENKLVSFNTQDGSMTLFDCDKGEVIWTYPFAKTAIKYTVTEFRQRTSGFTYDVNISQTKSQNIGGYNCNKAIVSCKMNGQETSLSEYWYTDSIRFPPCYLETFHRPGLVIMEETKIMGTHLYLLMTEINRADVSDENFIIPEDYEILSSKDHFRLTKKLNNAAKNKKNYAVGGKIPDVFWNF